MYHFVLRTRDRSPLMRDWTEGLALWRALADAAPGISALVIMPNHVHLLHATDLTERLRPVLSGFSRRQQAAWGRDFPGFEKLERPTPETDPRKVRRLVRYLALNPCRARLVSDPLSWPLSTHRDAVGLAWTPIVPVERRPTEHHRFVSSDPTVAVDGTALPRGPAGPLTADAVADAVCGLMRLPASALRTRGPARTAFLGVCRSLGVCDGARVATLAGCALKTWYHADPAPEEQVALVRRVLGDPRFWALPEVDRGKVEVWRRLDGG